MLVTGSSGHLGEALVRTLRDRNHEVVGLDVPRVFVYHSAWFDIGPVLSEALYGWG